MSAQRQTPAMLTLRIRWEWVQAWWEGIIPLDFATTQHAGRVFSPFRQVFMGMPERDFRIFLEFNPLLIFKDAHIDGTVYRL